MRQLLYPMRASRNCLVLWLIHRASHSFSKERLRTRCPVAGAGGSCVAPCRPPSWPSCRAGSPSTSVMQLWLASGGYLSSASCIMPPAYCKTCLIFSVPMQKGSGTQQIACKAFAGHTGHRHCHVNASSELCCLHCAQLDNSQQLRGRLCMAGFARTSNRAQTDTSLGSLSDFPQGKGLCLRLSAALLGASTGLCKGALPQGSG